MKILKDIMAGTVLFWVFISVCFAQSKDQDTEKLMRKITIIHAGTLMAIAGENTSSSQSIIIEDGKITDVKSSYVTTIDEEETEITIINLKDKFVMAGLMDMHVHFANSRGSDKNAADNALLAFQTLIKH